jgi:hypothetical protein
MDFRHARPDSFAPIQKTKQKKTQTDGEKVVSATWKSEADGRLGDEASSH